MRRGDIVRVQLPKPQGKAGREQFGTRPAIVIQTSKSAANLSTVAIVPLTSTLSAINFDGSFYVLPDGTNGLDLKSVVLTHQVRAIDKARIEAVIGNLSVADMATLESALRVMLGL